MDIFIQRLLFCRFFSHVLQILSNCLLDNVYLRIKTESVTAGADYATVNVWILFTYLSYKPEIYTDTSTQPVAGTVFRRIIQIIFGTVCL